MSHPVIDDRTTVRNLVFVVGALVAVALMLVGVVAVIA